MKELEKATEDLRFRISEDEIRPKAIAELLSSLNLTNVFKKQFKAMPEAYEIYTEKDIKDLEKVSTEVSVSMNINCCQFKILSLDIDNYCSKSLWF